MPEDTPGTLREGDYDVTQHAVACQTCVPHLVARSRRRRPSWGFCLASYASRTVWVLRGEGPVEVEVRGSKQSSISASQHAPAFARQHFSLAAAPPCQPGLAHATS